MARVAGVYKRVGPPTNFQLTIANNASFRRSIQDVLIGDFDRVIPGLGEIIESGGKQALLDGFERML